jgi:hypothetical protein
MEPLLQVMGMDTEEDESEWSISKAAYHCLDAFARLAEEPVYAMLFAYAREHMSDSDEVEIMRVLFSIQLIARMHIDESIEFLQSVFPAVINLTEAAVGRLAKGAYAVLLTIVEQQPDFKTDACLAAIFQCVQQTLTGVRSPDVIDRALLVSRSLFRLLDKSSYVVANWTGLLTMLYSGMENPVAAQDNPVLGLIYQSIRQLITALPDTFTSTALGPFIEEVDQQLAGTFAPSVTPLGLRQRPHIPNVILGLAHKCHDLIIPYAAHLYELLYQTFQTSESVELILAIAGLFMRAHRELDHVAGQAMDLAYGVLSDANPALVPGACFLISDLLRDGHYSFMGMLGPLLELLWSRVGLFAKDYAMISYLLVGYQAILSPRDDSLLPIIAEIMMPVRDDFMSFVGNLRGMLKTITEPKVVEAIFLGLLKIYLSVAQLYDFEAERTSQGSKQPGDFLAQFAGDYKELIQVGHSLGICSDEILDAFLDYLEGIIPVFGRFNNFNVKIHARGFAWYLEMAERSKDRMVNHRWMKVKPQYDQA